MQWDASQLDEVQGAERFAPQRARPDFSSFPHFDDLSRFVETFPAAWVMCVEAAKYHGFAALRALSLGIVR